MLLGKQSSLSLRATSGPQIVRLAATKVRSHEVRNLASIHSYVRNPRRFLVSRHEIGSFAREFATVFLRFRNRGNSCCRGIRCSFLLLARFCVSHARRNFEPRVGATLANASGNETLGCSILPELLSQYPRRFIQGK